MITEENNDLNFEESLYDSDKAFEENEELDEDFSFENFDGLDNPDKNENKTETPENEKEKKETPENENDLEFEENKNIDFDIESFNKKMGTSFKDEEEMKNFLSEKKEEQETIKEKDEIDKAEKGIQFFKEHLALDDEELLRRQLVALAVQKGLDPKDEDVNLSIEEEINNVKDKMVLDIKANEIRKGLREASEKNQKIIDDYNKKVNDKKMAIESQRKKTIQSAFSNIFKSKSFFGIVPEQERLQKAYSDVASGKLIERLESDPKLLAEVAILLDYKKEIHSKASGLTYDDGVKAILDEFNVNKQEKSKDRAPASGSSSVKSSTQNGLIADILYSSPIEDKK